MEKFFVHPKNLDQFQIVRNRQHLKTLVKEQMEQNDLQNQFFTFSQCKDRIYGKCFKCRARLSYRYNEKLESYKLVYAKNVHKHDNFLQERTQKICNFITSLPLSLERSSLKYLTMKEFSITSQQFYYYKNKIKGDRSQSFTSSCNLLQQMKFTCRYFPEDIDLENSIPDILLAVDTNLIKKVHQQQPPDIITFDVTYNCIKDYKEIKGQNDIIKKKTWGIGLFCGRTFSNKPIIFGFAVLNSQKEEDFVMIFQQFIQIVGSPSCIITDQQFAIKNALAYLKNKQIFKGLHRLDTFHILLNLKKKLKKSPIFSCLYNCIYSSNQNEYSYFLNKAKENIQTQNDQKVIKNFDQSSAYYCLCKSPNEVFQGFQLNTSTHEKLNDLLKRKIPYSVGVFEAVLKLLQFMAEVQHKSFQYQICKHQYQNILGNMDFKMIRFSVCEKVFMKFVKNYIDSLTLSIQKKSERFWALKDHNVIGEENKLHCSCNQFNKIGIPCIHMFVVLRVQKLSFLNQINKRWLIQSGQLLEKPQVVLNKRLTQIKHGYSKSTRRRMKNRY